LTSFKKLGLSKNILKVLDELGFEKPTEIQEQSIPILLEKDNDLIGLAQTGTGKTAAFGLPLLERIDTSKKATQGLILAPTRELGKQIAEQLRIFSKYQDRLNVLPVYGGANISEQIRALKKTQHVIIATPGRLIDLIKRKAVKLDELEYLVLDEADEMLNMGFKEDITAILSHTPDEKNTWLFSATMPKEVAAIAKNFMYNPKEITVGHKNEGSKNVSHEYYTVNSRDRYQALKRLADANPNIFSVVFCRTKRDTQKVAEQLIEDGYNAGALHGDLSQNQRDLVMKAFRNNQIQMLVATDVAARGIDVDDVTHVINYQLPDEIETYTHRSGRTGRAGKTGVSMVIVSKSEVRKIKSIERIIKKQFLKKDIPDGSVICEIQLMALANKIHTTEVNNEIDKHIDSINELFENTSKDELIKKFFSVEFTRFYNYYQKARDLNVSGSDKSGGISSDNTRYFINVGKKDGFDWMSLKDFLKEVLELGRDDVFKVETKDTFSFFNTENEHQQKVLDFFTDYKYNGRFVNVEVSENRKGGRRRDGRRGGKRDGKRNFSNNKNEGKRSDKKFKRSNSENFGSSRPRRSRRK